jgi:hypothetical protein
MLATATSGSLAQRTLHGGAALTTDEAPHDPGRAQPGPPLWVCRRPEQKPMSQTRRGDIAEAWLLELRGDHSTRDAR